MVVLNSSATTTKLKIHFTRSWNLASGYAAMEAMSTLPPVATTLTNRLLNRYRLNGTHMLVASLNRRK